MKKYDISQILLWLCFVIGAASAQETRLYSGVIQIPVMGPMEMTLGISETDAGTFLLLTVPNQGAKDIPLRATYKQDGSLSAELPQAELQFIVFENAELTLLTGTMIQGLEFEIEFERVTTHKEMVRPQLPEAPFPYIEYEVTAQHPEGHVLQGTLTIPEGRGPFPCAILISGSGMQDRDESLMGHKPFLVIADYLSRNGIAVLRYDDRGIGGSVMENIEDITGDTSEDFATDASVMVHAARIHPEIDERRVGVIGHSEGGLIGPMVAIGDPKLAFVIMLAGPGVAGFELLPVQQALILHVSGVDDELIERVINASMSFYELMQANASDEELIEQMTELITVQLLAHEIEVSEELLEQGVEEGISQMTSPWMRFFLYYDPTIALAQVTCPVLALNGTKDLQVDANQNLSAIEAVKSSTGNDITIIELEGLNHLFQPATTGSIAEYAQIEITFDYDTLVLMGNWISEVTDAE